MKKTDFFGKIEISPLYVFSNILKRVYSDSALKSEYIHIVLNIFCPTFFFTVRSTRVSKRHNNLLLSQTHQLLCWKTFPQLLYTIRIVNWQRTKVCIGLNKFCSFVEKKWFYCIRDRKRIFVFFHNFQISFKFPIQQRHIG